MFEELSPSLIVIIIGSVGLLYAGRVCYLDAARTRVAQYTNRAMKSLERMRRNHRIESWNRGELEPPKLIECVSIRKDGWSVTCKRRPPTLVEVSLNEPRKLPRLKRALPENEWYDE